MWATDGAMVNTVNEGRVRVFVAVDHFNAECIGFHVTKEGTRFAALQPLAMGLTTYRGGAAREAGRGITVRQDHGTQYTSDRYREQVKAWGMALSFALVGEPETNGVAERFIRTLKQQVVHGRVYAGVEQLREAVGLFVERYNRAWRVEKLGFMTPLEARAAAQVSLAA
jgi:transposase InsO family protein